MALTARQRAIIDGTASRLREIRDGAGDDKESEHSQADDAIRQLFDSLTIPEFNRLGDVYQQIIEGGWYA